VCEWVCVRVCVCECVWVCVCVLGLGIEKQTKKGGARELRKTIMQLER
jgi:hypothetical protein